VNIRGESLCFDDPSYAAIAVVVPGVAFAQLASDPGRVPRAGGESLTPYNNSVRNDLNEAFRNGFQFTCPNKSGRCTSSPITGFLMGEGGPYPVTRQYGGSPFEDFRYNRAVPYYYQDY
jgi:hypothetical protein